MPIVTSADDTPFCKACGYELTALTDSSKCPECGRPIVDVLVRASFLGQGKRYQSKATLFGWPLIAVASGPNGPERFGAPKGIVAIGDKPVGVIAIGGLPRGIVAIGGIARGIVAFGGFAIGIVSMGGFSLGALAFGGFALGAWAIGGFAGVVMGGAGGYVFRIRFW